jgi:hypothetical protein
MSRIVVLSICLETELIQMTEIMCQIITLLDNKQLKSKSLGIYY